MHMVRALIQNHRRLALLLILCALLVKALVPAGYMIGSNSKTLTVQLCADGLGAKMTRQIEIPMESGSHNSKGNQSKADGSCAFSSLAMGGVAGADAALLALALVFILVLGFAPVTLPRASPRAQLRPPLRGPPAAV